MKTLIRKFGIMATAILAAVTVSCSSDDEPASDNINSGSFGKVKVKSITVDGSTVAEYQFNADGQLANANMGGDKIKFDYNPFRILSEYQMEGTLGKSGFLNLLKTSFGTIIYNYDGQMRIQSLNYNLEDKTEKISDTEIKWNGGSVGQISTWINFWGSENTTAGIFKFNYANSYPNRLGQWPYFLGSVIVYGDDFDMMMISCGLLGIAPDRFPGEVVFTQGDYKMIFDIDYEFNQDGSISVENVMMTLYYGDRKMDEKSEKYMYNY